MAPIEAPQLRFLNDAANLLASQSPATATHLLSVHTQILHDEQRSLNVRQRKHHCGGCGSIRQSQCSKVTQVKPKTRGVSKKEHRHAGGGGAFVYKCLRCNQRTVIPRNRPASRMPSQQSSHATGSSNTSTTITSTNSLAEPSDVPVTSSSNHSVPKTIDNSNSKKRAKTRKQGGLQALLAAKKTSQPSLDLFDFLQ